MDGRAWWAAIHGVTKSRARLSDFTFTFHFHALEKEMATHSSVLAWKIPGTGEPGGRLSMGSHRVRYDWSDLAAAAAATSTSEAYLVVLVVKNLPVNAGDVRDMGSIPGSGRFPRKEGMATHSSILAWRIPWTEEPGGLTVHRVTNSKTQLKQLSMHTTSVSTNNTQVEDIMKVKPNLQYQQ